MCMHHLQSILNNRSSHQGLTKTAVSAASVQAQRLTNVSLAGGCKRMTSSLTHRLSRPDGYSRLVCYNVSSPQLQRSISSSLGLTAAINTDVSATSFITENILFSISLLFPLSASSVSLHRRSQSKDGGRGERESEELRYLL